MYPARSFPLGLRAAPPAVEASPPTRPPHAAAADSFSRVRRATAPRPGDAVASDGLALARRAILRDPAAWAEILDMARPIVYAAAVRLGRGDEREDLLQEVLVRLVRSLPTYRGDSPLRPWIASVCYNQVRNAWRRARRARQLVPLGGGALEVAAEPAPEAWDEEAAAEVRAHAALALRCLSAAHRRVLLLRVVRGLSVADTARRLGVREGTVKSRLSRALADVRVLAHVLRGDDVDAAAAAAAVAPAVARRRVRRALPALRAALPAPAVARLSARVTAADRGSP